MHIRALAHLFLCSLLIIDGCSLPSDEDVFLDPGIPRVETPHSQIAYVRTKWMNDKHIETAFLDSQDRELEVFRFNWSSSKTLNRYEGGMSTITINYSHSDSSPMGYVEIDTLRKVYDTRGRLVATLRTYGSKNRKRIFFSNRYYNRYYDYTTLGDTLITKVESSSATTDTSTVVLIDRWEKDEKKRLKQHYHLYVTNRPNRANDTVSYYSQHYSYNAQGQLSMVWYDLMYLGDHYWPPGPDTIYYAYDIHNRLIGEHRRCTADMRNKIESDTTGLSEYDKNMRSQHRLDFFAGKRVSFFANTYKYQYEVFDPKKHLPLKVPVNN